LKQKGKFPRPISLVFCRPRISVTHFASPGCLWAPLVAADQKANPAYPRFYDGGGSRRGEWPGSPRAKPRYRGPGVRNPQKMKQNVILVYNFYRFPVGNLGFNEYRSRAWTVYFADTIPKKV